MEWKDITSLSSSLFHSLETLENESFQIQQNSTLSRSSAIIHGNNTNAMDSLTTSGRVTSKADLNIEVVGQNLPANTLFDFGKDLCQDKS